MIRLTTCFTAMICLERTGCRLHPLFAKMGEFHYQGVGMTTPLSIIIPHKNTPVKLRRLLQSIPDSPHLEVVVVDDRSEPGLSAHTLQAAFPAVRFFSNPGPDFNAGSARNFGLAQVDSDWLLFADADDYFVDGGLAAVLSAIAAAPPRTEMLFFEATSWSERTQQPCTRHQVVSRPLRQLLADGDEHGVRFAWQVAWGKVIRSTLVARHGLRFDSVPAANDVMFSLLCGRHARAVAGFSRVLYCVTESDSSLTATQTPLHALSRLDVLIRANSTLMRWGIDSRLDLGEAYFLQSLRAGWSGRKLKVYGRYGRFWIREGLDRAQRRLSRFRLA